MWFNDSCEIDGRPFDAYARKETKVKIRKGWHRLERPNPPVEYYHYSNPRSQNSLICQTSN